MIKKPTIQQQHPGKIVIVVLGLCLILLSWVTPVLAATTTDLTQLEAEVLDIIRKHPEVINEAFQEYVKQQQEQQQQAIQAFTQQLKTDPKTIIGNSPTTGASEEKIILLEFSDFQCPFCAQAYKTVKKFMANHKNEVTLVYKFLPLTNGHPEAMGAAKAAWAAGQQGKFWEYHDGLFTQQKKLGEELYLSLATKLNLNLEQFNQDRQGDAAEAAITEDLEMAHSLKIRGTPHFIMNEEVIPGAYPLERLESALATVKQGFVAKSSDRLSDQGST